MGAVMEPVVTLMLKTLQVGYLRVYPVYFIFRL